MPLPLISRHELIGKVFDVVKDSGMLVGRGTAPKAGGWAGQAYDSEFRAYAVVKAGPARPGSFEPVGVGMYGASWDVVVQVIGHAETEGQADETAETAAELVIALPSEIVLPDAAWTLQPPYVSQISETQFSEQTKTWRTTYDVSLRLSREVRA